MTVRAGGISICIGPNPNRSCRSRTFPEETRGLYILGCRAQNTVEEKTMKEVNLKGTPINGLVEFVMSELTPQQYQDVLAKIPAEQQKYFSGHMLAHELVPVSIVNKFTEYAAELKKEPLKA